MADTKISDEAAATDLSGATFLIVQGGVNKKAAISLFAADAAAMEAGSSAIVFTTPSLQHRHPSAIKAWINFNGIGTVATRAGYNVDAVTDNGTGDYTVNHTTDFSSANYAFADSGAFDSSGGNVRGLRWGTTAAGSIRFTTENGSGTNTDSAVLSIIFAGDQ